MANWTANELENIATADELEIAPLRNDGDDVGVGPVVVLNSTCGTLRGNITALR